MATKKTMKPAKPASSKPKNTMEVHVTAFKINHPGRVQPDVRINVNRTDKGGLTIGTQKELARVFDLLENGDAQINIRKV